MKRLFRSFAATALVSVFSFGCSDRITNVENRLEGVEARADSLEERTAFLEGENARLRTDFDFFGEKLDDIKEGVDNLIPPIIDNNGVELETPPYVTRFSVTKEKYNDHYHVGFRGFVIPLKDLAVEKESPIFYSISEDLQNLGSWEMSSGTVFEVDNLGNYHVVNDTLFAERFYALELSEIEYPLTEKRRITFGVSLEDGLPRINYSLEGIEEIGYGSGDSSDEPTRQWSVRGHVNVLDRGNVVPVVFYGERSWTSGNIGSGFSIYSDGVYLSDSVEHDDFLLPGAYKYMATIHEGVPWGLGFTTAKE